MIDQNLIRLIVDAAAVASGDFIVEVGPGTGTLTDEILSRGAKVLAIEIDRDLTAALQSRFIDQTAFELIEGDALAGKHQLHSALLARLAAARGSSIKLVANLPYNIASPLVIELLIAGVTTLVFTVQKEVASRFGAAAGSDDYGPLSVMAQLLGRVELLRTLPPQAFWPSPKIESALVRITSLPIADCRLPIESVRDFGSFLHRVFSFRRKTLRKALREAGEDAEKILGATLHDGTRRPEVFTPAEFVAMWRAAGATRRDESPPAAGTPTP